jgi:hypothetical protein
LESNPPGLLGPAHINRGGKRAFVETSRARSLYRAGGRGSIFGTILGVLVIAVVNDGITLLNVESFWQDVVRGALLIVAVAIDQLRLRISSA